MTNNTCRLLVLLYNCGSVRIRHDLQNRTGVREEEPDDLHQHLLVCGIYLRDGHQRIRCSAEAVPRRKQPILESFNLRLRDHSHRLHSDADELL